MYWISFACKHRSKAEKRKIYWCEAKSNDFSIHIFFDFLFFILIKNVKVLIWISADINIRNQSKRRNVLKASRLFALIIAIGHNVIKISAQLNKVRNLKDTAYLSLGIGI